MHHVISCNNRFKRMGSRSIRISQFDIYTPTFSMAGSAGFSMYAINVYAIALSSTARNVARPIASHNALADGEIRRPDCHVLPA